MKKRLECHPFAAAGLFLLFFASPAPYAFAVLSSVFLHEAGHLTAALLFGERVRGIRLMPAGISIALSPPSSYAEEFCVAAAGPAMNLLYALAAELLPFAAGTWVRGISLFLACLNLLPLFPLDGGRMLSSFTASLFGAEWARRLALVFSLLFLSALWVLSLYILFYSGVNVMLLLFCAYLFSYIVLKKL